MKKSLADFMSVLIPFTPHLANECLEKIDKSKVDKWPKVSETSIKKQTIKIAIQINGKTREIIEIHKDAGEKEVVSITQKNSKISKSLAGKSVERIIFVKNKIINYLVK